MKLYNTESGNTKRVRIFLAEKGVDIPIVELEFGKDTRSQEFSKINSLGELPVLELDDGSIITESIAICKYIEAAYPECPLMGVSAFEQGHIEMWSQRIYGQIFMPYGLMVRHSLEIFSDIVDQVPEFAESQWKIIPNKWTWLNNEMSDGRAFIAGETFSFADVHCMVPLMISGSFGPPIPKHCKHVLNWANAMRERSSWKA